MGSRDNYIFTVNPVINPGVLKRLEEIAELSRQICNTPIAVITLIKDNTETAVIQLGAKLLDAPVSSSFSSIAMQANHLTVINDTLKDTRITDEVRAFYPLYRFYAGVPINYKQDHDACIGMLMVMDYTPRRILKNQEQSLISFASQIRKLLNGVVNETSKMQPMTMSHADTSSGTALGAAAENQKATQVSVLSLNTNGLIISADSHFSYLSGYPLSQLIGLEYVTLVHEDDRDQFMAEFQMVLHQAPRNCNLRIIQQNKNIVYHDLTLCPIIRDGKATGAFGISRDITEHVTAGIALNNNRMSLEHAIKAGHIAIWVFDLLINEVTITGDLQSLFGFTPPEGKLTLKDLLEVVYPEDKECLLRDPEHDEFHREFRVIWPDGSIHWLHGIGSIIRDKNGVPIRRIGAARNVTRERIYEEETLEVARKALHQQEEVLKEQAQLIQIAHDAIIVRDIENRIVSWNHGAEVIYGWTEDEVAGKDKHELLHTIYPKSFDEMRKALRNDGCWEGELNHTRKDGTRVIVESRQVVIRDEDNNPKKILEINRDITDRRQAEETNALSRKMESIGQLAAGIAHEINTPTQYIGDNIIFLKQAFNEIGTMLIKLDSITKTVNDPIIEELREYLQTLDLDYYLSEIPVAIEQSKDGVERITNIVKAMKDFSHPNTSQKSVIDINDIILSTITVSRNEWKYVSDLVTDLDRSLPKILCVPGDINQILINLIVNAADAIKEAIDYGLLNRGRIVISTKLSDNTIVIRINDNGIGISKEIQSRIFDPFFTTKEVGHGTGQGLSIAHALADKHNGTISVVSEKGRGATFTIMLPAWQT